MRPAGAGNYWAVTKTGARGARFDQQVEPAKVLKELEVVTALIVQREIQTFFFLIGGHA